MLRIHLVEAQNLIAKDNFMGGMVKGKSDPYVKIRVAGITYRSHTIKENLNPIWNELYEVCLMLPEVYIFLLVHFSRHTFNVLYGLGHLDAASRSGDPV